MVTHFGFEISKMKIFEIRKQQNEKSILLKLKKCLSYILKVKTFYTKETDQFF